MLTISRARLVIMIAIAIFAIAIIALGNLPGSRVNDPKSLPESLKIAVLTDALFDDKGWGTASYTASELIKSKYGFEVATEDNVAIPDIEQTLRNYAEAGSDLIIAHGFQWGDPALRVGEEYPNVKIVVFTGLVKSHNVASIFPMQQEGSFLLGALAGMMTKTNVIAYVGGEEYPNLINIFEGFEQGARAVNPEIRIVGTYLNDWDNPPKGKEATISIIRQQRADIIFHVADSSGRGVIEAAEENGVFALGAVQDQNVLAPNTVLSSFVLDIDKAYDKVVQSVMNGTFNGEILKPGIETEKGGAGEGIVYIAPFHSLDEKVPDNVKLKLQELRTDLLDERLVIPERLESTE